MNSTGQVNANPSPAVPVPVTMRATVLTGHGGIERLVFRDDYPTPVPGEGEVLVRVAACGMNNTDINTRTGWYDRAVDSAVTKELGMKGQVSGAASSWNRSMVGFPLIQGAAVVGHIAAVGPGVTAERVGQRVIVDPCVRDPKLPLRAQLTQYLGSERDGGYADYVAVPENNAHRIDSSLSDAELATFPCSYDTAEEMLQRARLGGGETIVITGAAGGVGTALIQLARLRGARVVAIAGAAKEERLRSLGAHAFVAREHDDVQREIERVIGEQGADVAADVVGGPMFGTLLKVLRRGGRYTTAGAIAGPVTSIDIRDLIYKDLEMHGITNPTAATFARLVDLIQSGRLQPLLEEAFPLQELAEGQAKMLKRTHTGKFVVTT